MDVSVILVSELLISAMSNPQLASNTLLKHIKKFDGDYRVLLKIGPFSAKILVVILLLPQKEKIISLIIAIKCLPALDFSALRLHTS